MNKNAVPTIIRGTTLKPGDEVFLILDRIEDSRDVFGTRSTPYIEARAIAATNGTSFAFVKKTYGRGYGAFAYLTPPSNEPGQFGPGPKWYLVSKAEADAALAVALAARLPYVEKDRAETLERISALQAHVVRLDERIAQLMAEDAVAP